MSSYNNKFIPIETLFNMVHLEQYVHKVLSCSSRYNNAISSSYAPINLVGKYMKYPSYGDFPEAYILRSYGKWWKQSKAYQLEYRPQEFDLLGAEDYVIIQFGSPVVPRDICIYEIYNPGAIVRIWGLLDNGSPWVLLWEGFPQKCPHKSRKFCPPLRKVNCLISIVRLEFNQSHLEYHTSLDAVVLGGYQPMTNLQYSMIEKGFIDVPDPTRKKSKEIVRICDMHRCSVDYINSDYDVDDYFWELPYEVMLHIFHYLDLKTLAKCAQVNKRWYKICRDPVLYQNISLQTYWYLIDNSAIECFIRMCSMVKKLDLSWCGNNIFNFSMQVSRFIKNNKETITNICLGNCSSVDEEVMNAVAECKNLEDLRLKNTTNWMYASLDNVTKLVSLDLTATKIQDSDVIRILKENPNLQHIVLDLCEDLQRLDQVIDVLANCNKKIMSWSSWKTHSLTSEGVKKFRFCENLEELDLGWCLVNTDPGNCLTEIANGCKKLKRLIISEWRGASDQQILPIVHSCKELTQLDFLGIKNITAELCENALLLLPKLRLLEISFCDGVRPEEVEIWNTRYPHITIQRSCQYVVTDYLN